MSRQQVPLSMLAADSVDSSKIVNGSVAPIDLQAPFIVPAGGTSGQVLQKTSAADYATGWVTPAPGVLAMPDGTIPLPGWAFANDTDTGFHRPGADQLVISTGGGERLRVKADGVITLGVNAAAPLIRNPANASAALSLEAWSSYTFLCAGLNSHVTSNAYWDGSNWLRMNTAGVASYLGVTNAALTWNSAPSGTGAIAFTNRFSVDSSAGPVTAAFDSDTASGRMTLGPSYGIIRTTNGHLYLRPNSTNQVIFDTGGTLTVTGTIASANISNSGTITTGAINSNDWFRLNVSGQGIYNSVTARGIGLGDPQTLYPSGDVIVGRTLAETLSNKTLTDPRWTGPTGFTAAGGNDLTNYMFQYGAAVSTLPAASGRAGQIRFIKAWGQNLTVNSASTNLMPPGSGGSIVSSFVLANGDSLTMICDGTYWWTV